MIASRESIVTNCYPSPQKPFQPHKISYHGPFLESAVSKVINAWLKKYTDPTKSCLPHFWAVLHILRLRVTHIISHAVGKGLGLLEEILRMQEAIFQFRLPLDTNFAYNPDCSLELYSLAGTRMPMA